MPKNHKAPKNRQQFEQTREWKICRHQSKTMHSDSVQIFWSIHLMDVLGVVWPCIDYGQSLCVNGYSWKEQKHALEIKEPNETHPLSILFTHCKCNGDWHCRLTRPILVLITSNCFRSVSLALPPLSQHQHSTLALLCKSFEIPILV